MTTPNVFENALPAETGVLIVGAGPTGLALAIALQQAGVDHLLVDKLPAALNTSRAGVIHAHTLEMLESLGVTEQLCASGLHMSDFRIRDRGKTLLKLDFQDLPTSHSYLLMVPQDVTERILAERLEALGGTIHRGVTVTGARQNAEFAEVSMETANGESTVRARFVVGGDGIHSVVRTAAGAEFEGSTYQESFVLADVKMDWSLKDEVSLFFSPAGMVVVAPMPNEMYRVVAVMDPAPERPGVADIQGLLDSRGPAAGQKTVKEVIWSSRFRIHHRVAKSYRNGRFLLMGDAAHVHSPAGGQGMNTGLVDAVVLGQLLVRAMQTGDDRGLDAYHQLRQPAAVKVLSMAGRLTDLATVRGGVKRMFRNLVLSVINRIPPARRRFEMNLSGLSRRVHAMLPG